MKAKLLVTEVRAVLCGLCVALGSSVVSAGEITSTGATVTTDGDDTIYTFSDINGVGTLVVPEGGQRFDILLVGGGGAGGWCRGGGGGAGGFLYQRGVTLEAGTYTITVGAGGTPDVFTSTYAAGPTTADADGKSSLISFGGTALFNAIPGNASIKWVQGSHHGNTPPLPNQIKILEK